MRKKELLEELNIKYSNIVFDVKEETDSITLLHSNEDDFENETSFNDICNICEKYLDEEEKDIFAIVFDHHEELPTQKSKTNNISLVKIYTSEQSSRICCKLNMAPIEMDMHPKEQLEFVKSVFETGEDNIIEPIHKVFTNSPYILETYEIMCSKLNIPLEIYDVKLVDSELIETDCTENIQYVYSLMAEPLQILEDLEYSV